VRQAAAPPGYLAPKAQEVATLKKNVKKSG